MTEKFKEDLDNEFSGIEFLFGQSEQEEINLVEDADIYNEAKSFSTAASRGDVEAKPTVEGEPVKEAPKSNNTESNEDVPF